MRVLFVSAEIYPLAKTGGLGDVSAALPLALSRLGVDIRLMMPAYPQALASAANKQVHGEIADIPGLGPARLIAAQTPDSGLPLWLVDCPALFQRSGGLYVDPNGADWPDNAQRYALLSHVAARVALGKLVPDWRSDIVHCNDWHTGLVPLLLRAAGGRRPATVFTIHNMAFQGVFPFSMLGQLGLPEQSNIPDSMEFWGQLSFLKAGIAHGDRITTVSPRYSHEILRPEHGCGLDGSLRERAADLAGILNGVDYRIWDPGADPYLPAGYGRQRIAGKRVCKAELQRELGLDARSDAPLLASVARITDQKMADTVLAALPEILARDAQFALLGEGDGGLEREFRAAAGRFPGRIAVRIGYEEPLAHRLFAGADLLLHPSRFEPCGLAQLYALRYGTLPIVRSVGGLADTVVDCNRETTRQGNATGFVFEEATAEAMLGCLDRALELYRQPLAWRRVQRTAMRQDFGWTASAQRYLDIYRELAPDTERDAEAEVSDARGRMSGD